MASRGMKPNQNGSKSTSGHLPPLSAEGALSSPFLICRSGSFPSAFRSAGVLPAHGSAVCLSLHFRGGECEAPAPWALFCDSGERKLQPPETSEPGESLRTSSGRGGPRRGWEAASPQRGPRSGPHFSSPGAPSLSRWVPAWAGRAARGHGGGAPGPASARCPRVSSAPHHPSPGAPSLFRWVPVPAHSPCSPARRGRGGPSGTMEAAGARGRHGDAAVRYGGGGGHAVSKETSGCTAARGLQTAQRALGVGAAPARGRGSGRKDSAAPAACALLCWAVGDTHGGGVFPTMGTRAPRPRASC